MNKSITSRLFVALTFIALTAGLSLASVSATAARGVSQGGGVKCYWVVVATGPNNSQTLSRVCTGKGA